MAVCPANHIAPLLPAYRSPRPRAVTNGTHFCTNPMTAPPLPAALVCRGIRRLLRRAADVIGRRLSSHEAVHPYIPGPNCLASRILGLAIL